MISAALLLSFAVSVAGGEADKPAPQLPSPEVVFVCEHGTVKSVMAAHWFNRLAAERNAPFRAVSRGVAPDEAIPAAVAGNLVADGFDVAAFAPKGLTKADVVAAAHVVSIGADSPLLADAKTPVTRWADIPAASIDYTASRDAMRARMGALLDALGMRQHEHGRKRKKAAPKGRP